VTPVSLGLLHGAALCAWMGATIWGSLRHDPFIWAGDFPDDMKAAAGPPPPETAARKRVWAGLIFGGMFVIFGHLAWRVSIAGGGFADTALAALIAFETFNLFDAVCIDVPLVWLRPAWALPNGVGPSPTMLQPRWHVVNFAKGALGGVPFALLVAAASALLA
jgi:hypothetical protein